MDIAYLTGTIDAYRHAFYEAEFRRIAFQHAETSARIRDDTR